jgi:hypothetical protein
MDPPRGGKSANESVCQTRVIQFEYWHMQQSQCRLTGRNFKQDTQLEASVFYDLDPHHPALRSR